MGIDPIEYHELLMKRVAYATRYGHITLAEAMGCDVVFLVAFNKALNSIVEEEMRER